MANEVDWSARYSALHNRHIALADEPQTHSSDVGPCSENSRSCRRVKDAASARSGATRMLPNAPPARETTSPALLLTSSLGPDIRVRMWQSWSDDWTLSKTEHRLLRQRHRPRAQLVRPSRDKKRLISLAMAAGFGSSEGCRPPRRRYCVDRRAYERTWCPRHLPPRRFLSASFRHGI